MRSFTLIEILITIFLLFILISFTVSVGLSFYKSQQLKVHAQGISQTLRRAQSKAMSVELDSSFGVYLTNEHYALFLGNSYLERDPQYDEIFELPEILNLSGLSEIVFLKLEGIPNENLAYCGGECIPCDEFTDRGPCKGQDGCSWNARLKRCTGTCTPCDSYENQAKCEDQSGCTWHPVTRGGDIILTVNSDNRIININEMGRVNLE